MAAPIANAVVIDTNVVLDLFVFDDPMVSTLRDALTAGAVTWIASQAMRERVHSASAAKSSSEPISSE